jgi:hypothetical protein
MNKDYIISMARESGVAGVTVYDEQSEADILHPDLEKFARLIAATEREACAELVSDLGDAEDDGEFFRVLKDAAIAIRARGNK